MEEVFYLPPPMIKYSIEIRQKACDDFLKTKNTRERQHKQNKPKTYTVKGNVIFKYLN